MTCGSPGHHSLSCPGLLVRGRSWQVSRGRMCPRGRGSLGKLLALGALSPGLGRGSPVADGNCSWGGSAGRAWTVTLLSSFYCCLAVDGQLPSMVENKTCPGSLGPGTEDAGPVGTRKGAGEERHWPLLIHDSCQPLELSTHLCLGCQGTGPGLCRSLRGPEAFLDSLTVLKPRVCLEEAAVHLVQ